MRHYTAADLARVLEYGALVEKLRTAFREGRAAPARHHHRLPPPPGADPDEEGTLLLMPAWTFREPGRGTTARREAASTGDSRQSHSRPTAGGRGDGSSTVEYRFLGVKVATVQPANSRKGLPAVMASYLLLSGDTGEPLALLDGGELTARRTACASALAADHLAQPHASHLLMVGTGRLAPHLVRAHATVREYDRVGIWGRSPGKARALARKLEEEGAAPEVRAVPLDDLGRAARDAHVISCATLSRAPLVRGAWLRPGAHLDLVGAYTPRMRESDDEAVRRARVHVDTREGALAEAGDVLLAIESGALTPDGIEGDLFQLVRGEVPGRAGPDEITLFKSVGNSLEDLAAAELAFERMG